LRSLTAPPFDALMACQIVELRHKNLNLPIRPAPNLTQIL
jgi:hypothetical protein